LKCADLALYAGKIAGRNCFRFFTPDMDEALKERIALEATVRDAVANDGITIFYQPIFEMSGQRLVGYEALARLIAQDGTFIAPDNLYPAPRGDASHR
jgi:predicted signal transduction protein with EAL and GGDEF domain